MVTRKSLKLGTALATGLLVTTLASTPAQAHHAHDVVGPVAAFIALNWAFHRHHHGHHRHYYHHGHHGHHGHHYYYRKRSHSHGSYHHNYHRKRSHSYGGYHGKKHHIRH